MHQKIITRLLLSALALVCAAPARADFTIPNVADAFHAHQAQVDKVDLDIMVAGIKGTGVLTGSGCSAQGSPDMTVAVAAGTVRVGTTIASVTSGNATITTANGTNPRFDLVVADNTGAKSVTAGTAAASPVFPAIPASSVVLCAVYVPANDTTIASNQITDKRIIVNGQRRWKLAADYTNNSTTGTEITGLGPMTVAAAGTYHLFCALFVQSAATTTSPKFGVNYTGTATAFVAHARYPSEGVSAATGQIDNSANATTGQVWAYAAQTAETTTSPNLGPWTGVSAADTNVLMHLESLLTVSDTGDVEVWGGSEVGSSTITVKAGSWCELTTL